MTAHLAYRKAYFECNDALEQALLSPDLEEPERAELVSELKPSG